MNLKRTLAHLNTSKSSIKRSFPSLARIEQEIKQSEAQHSGQIRFVVEASLDWGQLYANVNARDRAIEVFSQLRVWDTEHNNGILIYLLLADHDIEIIADRGINAKLKQSVWQEICVEMEQAFQKGQFEQGVVLGIQAITQQLIQHFPAEAGQLNELSDEAVVL